MHSKLVHCRRRKIHSFSHTLRNQQSYQNLNQFKWPRKLQHLFYIADIVVLSSSHPKVTCKDYYYEKIRCVCISTSIFFSLVVDQSHYHSPNVVRARGRASERERETEAMHLENYVRKKGAGKIGSSSEIRCALKLSRTCQCMFNGQFTSIIHRMIGENLKTSSTRSLSLATFSRSPKKKWFVCIFLINLVRLISLFPFAAGFVKLQ